VNQDDVLKYIREHRIVKIVQLSTYFQCSASTIFRKLRGNDYLTSYNFDRQYLTLSDIPEFDSYGLWEYQQARFSRYGGIRPTIESIVHFSKEGLSAGKINDILNLRVNNQLGLCVKEGRIVRKRYGRFQIYFSSNEQNLQQQINKRGKPRIKQPQSINVDIIIRILVAVIKNHDADIDHLMVTLHNEGVDIPRRMVKQVFDKYEIEKKGSP